MVYHVFVLTARGFSSAHLGGLLWKQMLFFGTVTLPSIALGSLVSDFKHFIIAGFTIAAGIAILNGGFQRFPEFRGQESEVRHAAVRILLATAALAVIWTQYARRRVIRARMMAKLRPWLRHRRSPAAPSSLKVQVVMATK